LKARKKDTRLEARVSEDVHQLVRTGAELLGITISQFLVNAVESKAREVTYQAMHVKLTLEGAERMMAALENPPPISDALLTAAKRYRERGYN